MLDLANDHNSHVPTMRDGVAAKDSSAVSSSLLALPSEGRNLERDPFRPTELDTTSLSMKRRHHTQHQPNTLYRTTWSNDDLESCSSPKTHQQGVGLIRSSSVPCIRDQQLASERCTLPAPVFPAIECASTTAYQQRWTPSSKSASTRGLSTLNPICQNSTKHRRRGPQLSPAVVTLRRASSSPSRGLRMTFFPPPKLNHSRRSFLSILTNTITGADRERETVDEQYTVNKKRGHNAPPVPPVLRVVAQPTESSLADPAITQITIEPVLTNSHSDIGPSRARRCSTMYFTRSSVHEIIWDENDTPSSSSCTSSTHEIMHEFSRRQSAAVAHLETHFAPSTAQSHRASVVIGKGGVGSLDSGRGQSSSFQKLLNQSLSRLMNESALRNLPRSKASKNGPGLVCNVPAEMPSHQIVEECNEADHQSQNETFPSLQWIDKMKASEPAPSLPSVKVAMNGLAATASESTSDLENDLIVHGGHNCPRDAGTNILWNVSPFRPRRTSPRRMATSDDTVPLLDAYQYHEHSSW